MMLEKHYKKAILRLMNLKNGIKKQVTGILLSIFLVSFLKETIWGSNQ